jgi:hypothetical protein
MAKSSLDYSEQHGLMIALSNLEVQVYSDLKSDPAAYDNNHTVVMDWMKKRIKTLGNK